MCEKNVNRWKEKLEVVVVVVVVGREAGYLSRPTRF